MHDIKNQANVHFLNRIICLNYVFILVFWNICKYMLNIHTLFNIIWQLCNSQSAILSCFIVLTTLVLC